MTSAHVRLRKAQVRRDERAPNDDGETSTSVPASQPSSSSPSLLIGGSKGGPGSHPAPETTWMPWSFEAGASRDARRRGCPSLSYLPYLFFELHIIVITINGVVRLSYHDTDLYCF